MTLDEEITLIVSKSPFPFLSGTPWFDYDLDKKQILMYNMHQAPESSHENWRNIAIKEYRRLEEYHERNQD